MKMCNLWKKGTVLLGSVLLLAACGGGGGGSSDGNGGSPAGTAAKYHGKTVPVVIANQATAESVAQTTAELAKYGKKKGDADGAIPFAVQVSNLDAERQQQAERIAKIIAQFAANRVNLPTAVTYPSSVPGDCGGSAGVAYSNGQQSMTWVYHDFKAEGGDPPSCATPDTINGSLTAVYKTGSTTQLEKITFNGLKVKMGGTGEVFVLNGTFSYDYCGGTSPCAVTFSEVYVGADGETYRVDDLNVRKIGTSSYTVSGKIYDPDYGYFTITTAQNLTYCADGWPMSGEISISANGQTATVEFSGCNPTTVTFTSTIPGAEGPITIQLS